VKPLPETHFGSIVSPKNDVVDLHSVQHNLEIENTGEKLLWRTCRNSPMLIWTVPSPTPMASPSPRPKMQSLSQEWVKLRTANLVDTFRLSVFGSTQMAQHKQHNSEN